MSEAQIAVLIDFENVGLGSIQGLFDQLSDLGRIIVKRAYADWSSAGKQRDQVLELGIEAVHHFHAAKVAKNSSDISLAIDAIDLLYRSPVDTFVVVSADSDFVTLVSKLRSAGKTVIGAGRRDVVSTTLVRACDRYIYLDTAAKVQPVVAKPGDTKDLEALLVRAIEASVDDDGRVVGSKLHQTMTRIDPSFDFKALGYRTFTQFLESSSAVQITRDKGSDDIRVRQKSTGLGRLPGIGRVLGGRGRKLAATAPQPETPRPAAPPRPTVLPASQPATPQPAVLSAPEPPQPTSPNGSSWDAEIHNRWSRRVDETTGILNGTRAAGEAARVLGVSKLSASRYKTLQKLLSSSALLSARWTREGNTLHVKT